MQDRPQIDFRKISFPSDSLTIGSLREKHPADLDAPDKTSPNLRNDSQMGTFAHNLSNMLYVEREIAQIAFTRTLEGRPVPFQGNEDWEACRSELANYYARYGLASGKHHAEQLFRDIEAQSVAQARQHIGRLP